MMSPVWVKQYFWTYTLNLREVSCPWDSSSRGTVISSEWSPREQTTSAFLQSYSLLGSPDDPQTKFLTSTASCSAFQQSQFYVWHLSSGSVQFSRSVMSDSLWPHEQQHSRPPCPTPTPGTHPNSCPLSQWCHPSISSSVVPFSSCPQSFPASGSFHMSQLFASGG